MFLWPIFTCTCKLRFSSLGQQLKLNIFYSSCVCVYIYIYIYNNNNNNNNRTRLLLLHWSCLHVQKTGVVNTYPWWENSSMMKYIYLIKSLITCNHVILPCSRIYTPFHYFLMQLCSKYLVKSPSWELDSTENRSLRDFQILIINVFILCQLYDY